MTRPWMVTALVVAGFAFAASPSQAALSITVSTTADNVSGNTTANVGSCATGGACTLRQAINTADITANAGSTITVPAGMYVISNAAGFGDLPQIYKSTTINGGINASTIIDGGSAATGLTYAFDLADDGTNAVTSTLNNLTIQHFVKGNQGIVYVHPTQNGSVVNFNNGVIQNNASSDGGAGIINTGHGTVRVDSSEIKGNNSAGASNGAAGDLEVSVAANLVVTNSAVVNNTGHASAICIGCQFATTGTTFTFTNNTISGNVLTGQPVINDAKGLATFSYNTIANNTPGSGSAVINRSAASGDNFKGNIVSGNTGTNCAFTGAAPTKSGFNYDSGTTCGFEHPSTAVTLGTLQNNGGPTDTQALPPGSPVIDTGGTGGACTTAGGSALTSDQRATPRPQGTQCDPGAYEALSGPTCQGLTKTTGAGQPLAIQLSCAGTGTLTYAIVGNPSHGSLSGFNASTGAVTYTPTAGYFGPDSFTYNATNAGGTSSTVTVAITVTTPPPTCRAVQASTKISVPVSIHLDCSDAAAAPLTYSIDTPPSHGGLGSVDQSTGNVTYTPVAGFAGNDSFVYHATSSNGTTSTQLVTIFVSESGAPPAAPTCRAVQASTGAGAPVTIQFSCTD
jgi:CSLREA domain-containing protein